MSTENKFGEHTLNEIVTAIREERVDERVMEQAAGRVWARVAESRAPAPLIGPEGVAQATAHQIRGCGDFQALMPAYLAHTLPEARRLLLQDHLVGCVACRHALEAARSGERSAKVNPLRIPERTGRSKQWGMAWALAAVLVTGVAIGLLGPERVFNRGQAEAVLQSADGRVDKISDSGTAALTAGQPITGNQEIRTARDSSAVVRLVDGTSVEMNQRADLWLSRGWRGTTIHLERGNIIVHAAEQGHGRLDVATRDCLVSVKGTIFAVDAGVKGSRVSVIRGEVQVAQGRKLHLLRPGQQLSTAASLTSVPVAQEVAWSRNSGEYVALLSEFGALHKQLEAIPSPASRYDSALLKMLPADTVLYAAIPNLGSSLAEANRIFQDRLQQSEVLQQWWKQKQASGDAQKVQEMIDRVRSFSDYVGDEIVIAMPAGHQSPLLLAEARRPDLGAFIQQQLSEISPNDKSAPVLISNPGAITTGGNERPLILIKNNILAVGTDAAQLQEIATLADHSASGGFASTPFYAAVQQAYQSGTEWLFCADVEQILSTSVLSIREPKGPGYEPFKDPNLGLVDMRYLVMESKDVDGKAQNRATLTFARDRRGVAAWLASPSPMGTLDFVSPQASFAVSFVAQEPRQIVQQMIGFIESDEPQASQDLADFESKTGVSLSDDLAASLGGEVTVALDGPVLPTPSWKLAVEVSDPMRLQTAVEKLVASYNQQPENKTGAITLTQQASGGRTFYELNMPQVTASSGIPAKLDYVFVDGYLLAAPSQALLLSSIQNREAGYTLTRSTNFTSQLPGDGYVNFSAVVYQNVGAMLAPIANILKSTSVLTPAQRQSIDAIRQNTAPSLVCAYGGPDTITIANTGSLFAAGFESFLGINRQGPLEILHVLREAKN
ncbi:MAG TPA: FecR domain-containing protein [Terriglobia bacterium]|nr:FecR domain-containing protein [Terriglobia bacterium]